MPQVGFDPTIAVFELAKKFHALDNATSVTATFRLHSRSNT
jgi:hypothetical protein